MPTPPDGLFQRINYVTDFFIDPCDAPLTVYAKTAAPALLNAFITYFALDLKNILTAFARPSKALGRRRGQKKGRRGRKRGRWGKRYAWSRIIDFDPNEYIGKKMPFADDLGNRKVSAGIVSLWVAEGLIERLLYWIMVADIVLNFFVEWTSAIYEAGYCDEQEASVLYATSDLWQIAGPLSPSAFQAAVIEKERGGITWFINQMHSTTPGLSVAAAFTIPGDLTEGVYVRAEMVYGTSPEGAVLDSAQTDPEGGADQRLGVAADIDDGQDISVWMYSNAPGLVLISDSCVWGH